MTAYLPTIKGNRDWLQIEILFFTSSLAPLEGEGLGEGDFNDSSLPAGRQG
jgi:hypothetical protein